MPAPTDGPLEGRALLDAVAEAMVALHVHYHGRAPGHTHCRLMDGDLLVVLMGEVYTEVEKTMIELQRQASVKQTRNAFQHVGPDLELELFFLEPLAR